MKVEVGKRYVRRDGSISGVMEDCDGHDGYPFADQYESYTAGGKYYADSTKDHEFDLVSEYVEPGQSAGQTIPGLEEYKVLRYGRATKGDWYIDAYLVCRQWDHSSPCVGNFVIVEPPTPPALPKRTIVFREVAERYGDCWVLNWLGTGFGYKGFAKPDESVPTGNERTVEL